MNRFTARPNSSDMRFDLWLAFDADGGARMTRSKPNLGRTERGMQLSITLPVALFKTPELAATIKVESPTSDPVKIDATAAGEALSAALGFPVDLRIIECGE